MKSKRAARQWQWHQGWWTSNGNGEEEGNRNGNGDKGGGQATAMATKRAMVTAMRVVGNKEGD